MMEENEAIAVMTGMITAGATIVTVLRALITNVRRARVARAQAEIMNKLVDKVGSSPELGRWLESGGAKQFFEFEAVEKENPRARILNSIQTGLVATGLGAGLMAAGARHEALQAAGIILICVGAGFLVSSGASFALSKSWGLLTPPAAPTQETPDVR